MTAPPADFGSPPSGQIPILYNDRHVYSTPDVLKQARVLAALVHDGTLYIPLRSMFEQMGAPVSYDPASKTATVSKPGAEIVVTVGKPEVIVNGESRPLDVPPIVYHGDVLVPVRVISEGMGAYVQWVPDKRLVVVRYIPATPPPTELRRRRLRLRPWLRLRRRRRQRQIRYRWAAISVRITSPASKHRTIPARNSTSRRVRSTTRTASTRPTWNTGLALHGDYAFPNSGFDVGATYLYANPMDGPCVVPANHLKGEVCVTQIPPSTNPVDNLPGYTMSTFYEAYLKYDKYGWNGALGNVLFNSPWANGADTRLKPQAYEGGYVGYTSPSHWNFQAADMLAFECRVCSTFSQTTLITSYPTGQTGLAPNIVVNGGNGIKSDGFTMGKVGYADNGLSVDGYFYGVYDIANMWWGDAKWQFNTSRWAPYIALQGGTESNAGQSYVGKVNSQVFGAQIGFNILPTLQLQAGYDQVPWKNDSVFLPKNVTCSNSNYQITAKGATLAYFLPIDTAQCYNNPNGTTQVYYGGWASPYTDNTDSDPLFTTSTTQGQVDRRAPGSSEKVALIWQSTNYRWLFRATDAWYNYGNALAPENTNIWTLLGTYHFSKMSSATGPYHGLLLRDYYINRTLSNTFCGASGTDCPSGSSLGSTYFGGLPLNKQNRAELEYDF